MTALKVVQLISPYHPSLALNGGGFPDGFSCRHSNPIRYVVRGASHQPHNAWQARPRRDRQEHAGYSRQVPEYIQLCDIVSHLSSPLQAPTGFLFFVAFREINRLDKIESTHLSFGGEGIDTA